MLAGLEPFRAILSLLVVHCAFACVLFNLLHCFGDGWASSAYSTAPLPWWGQCWIDSKYHRYVLGPQVRSHKQMLLQTTAALFLEQDCCSVLCFLPAATLQYLLMNTIFYFCYLLSFGHPLFTSLKVWMLHFICPLECCSIVMVSEEVWQAIVIFWRSFFIWSIVLCRLIILNDQAS
jgi:hypothetical protein